MLTPTYRNTSAKKVQPKMKRNRLAMSLEHKKKERFERARYRRERVRRVVRNASDDTRAGEIFKSYIT